MEPLIALLGRHDLKFYGGYEALGLDSASRVYFWLRNTWEGRHLAELAATHQLTPGKIAALEFPPAWGMIARLEPDAALLNRQKRLAEAEVLRRIQERERAKKAGAKVPPPGTSPDLNP